MRIAVMGAGGVGGYFGGLLARAGKEVTFIARGAHLDAIRREGLRVASDLSGEFTVQSDATDDPGSVGPVDLVLYTVKMYHNAEAIPALAPMVGPETVVLTLQNGVGNAEELGAALGRSRVMVGAAFLQARIPEVFCRQDASSKLGYAPLGAVQFKDRSKRPTCSMTVQVGRLNHSTSQGIFDSPLLSILELLCTETIGVHIIPERAAELTLREIS